MKKQFQSKSVPRGTRTIWRYLGAFILLFSLSIGQMWGASTITVKLYVNGGGTISASGWESKSSGTYYQKKVNKSTAFDLPAPTREGFTFDEWNTSAEGTGSSYTTSHSGSGSNINLYAQWTELPKYTVTYYQGTGVLLTEQVYQGSSPKFAADILEHYTSGSWYSDAKLTSAANPATDAISAAKSYYLSATGPKYATDVDLYAEATGDKTNINTLLDSKDYVSDIVWNSSNYDDGNSSYYGYKCKTNGDWVEFLLKRGDEAKVTFKYIETNFVIYAGSTTGTAVTNDEKSYSNSSNDIIVRIVNNCVNGKSATINKIQIIPTYTATLVDSKSDGAGSQANVTETTLPTPTAVSGWTFTGWIANEDVKAGEDTKTAGTVLAAGTYTLLANTTFTAQWAEASSTYDITYVSAHGTAPDAENAASVVLAELSEDGWAHKGWTANADVTVDAATVEAGTLIANGKTVVLASNVTFTAVWKEIFTVTFDSKGGSAVDPIDVEDGASIAAAPADPTKDDYVFQGWSETDGGAVVADITALTISGDKTLYASWALDVQVSEIVFSNSFKGWIVGSTVTVFYMAGESAPTIASYAGKNLKAEGGVVISGDKIIATGTDDSEVEFDLTMTEVTPLTTTGAKQTFDGFETYVKSAYGWKWHETDASKQKGWAFQKLANDGRIAKGLTREYFFFGPAESATFTWKVAKKNDGDPAVAYVYVDGELANTVTSKTDPVVVPLKNTKSIVAFESAQTNGDCGLMDVTLAPWVPVTAVTLKEGEDEISAKEIWASTSFTLTAEVTPDNASDKTITWTSSDDAVATVVNGVVTGVAANATPVTITASTVDGVKATCSVTVTAAPEPCETPVITADPASQAYCAGSEPTLTVAANDPSDGGTLHYAWFKAGETDEAVGTDAASYTVEAAGTYYVIVTNKKDGNLDASATSANAVVTLNAPASITTQPTDLKKQTEGANITLSVVAANATAYQWYSCDNNDKENPVLISGADEAEYEFAAAAGFFYCEVTGLCGAIESNVAQVTVKRSAGCQYITATSGYEATLADGLKLYACGSDGKTSTDGIFADATSDVTTVDANAVGEFNKQYIIMKFPVDVEEITLYGTNSSDRSINSVRVKSTIGSTSADKFTDDMIVATTKTATREGKDISMTAVMDEPISKDDYVFVNFNGGSMHVYRICYTEALPKPVLPTLSNQEYCAGGSFVAWNAETTVTEGTLSYQWYDADADEAIEGATNWAYTPTANGHYYVKVTNASAGRVSQVTQSSTLSAMIYDAMTITTAPEDVTTQAGVAASLSVEASGNSLSYAWYTCDANGDNAVALDPAVTTAELNVTAQLGVQYYKVVVTDDCDAELSAVAKVEGIATLPLVAINGSYTWDFTKASAAQIKLDGNTAVKKDEEAVMVNIPGVEVDQSKFKSQALKFSGEYIHRTDDGTKYPACATTIKFETTVPGKVTVVFADNGGNNRRLSINGNISEASTGKTDYKTYSAVVPAGEVVLTGYKDNAGGKYIRFFSIDFTAASELNPADADYTRDVTEGRYGTICLENGGVMVGATLYEVAYYGETSKKIFFDEILNGEMEAGVPYIYLPNENATQLGVFYTDAAGEDEQSANGLVGYIGESEATEHALPVPVGSYILNNNQYREVVYANSAYILSHRAYINLSAINPSEPALVPGRRRISMSVQSEQVVTGIDALNVGEQPVKMIIDGKLYILRGEKMYDATGRLVK